MAFHGRSGRVALVESSDEYALGWMAYKLARIAVAQHPFAKELIRWKSLARKACLSSCALNRVAINKLNGASILWHSSCTFRLT
jgi:hypothetical protein